MDLAKNSFESLKQRVWVALSEGLGDDAYRYDIVHTFPEACILRDYNAGTYYRVEFEDAEGVTTLKSIEEVNEAYVVETVVKETGADEQSVAKALKAFDSTRLMAPIVNKSADEKRIAYGPVLIPDEPDSDGDVVSREKIEEVAHKFLRDYGNIDLQHTLNVVARPVESYITKSEMTFGDLTVPEGSWMMGVYIEDDPTWEAVKSGDIGGFSIMGVRKATAEEALKSEEPVALKRTTLADLGDDWVCTFVSVVDTPAVPKAKFVMVKSATKDPNVIERLLAKLPGAKGKAGAEASEKAGRRFSKTTYDKLKAAYEAMTSLMEDAAKEHETETAAEKQVGREDEVDETKVQELINTALEPVGEALKGISEALTTLTAQKEAPATEPVTEPAAKAEGEGEGDAESIEALKSTIEEQGETIRELTEFKEQVEKRFGGAAPKGLKGQDGEGEGEPATKSADLDGRDAYGRRVRS